MSGDSLHFSKKYVMNTVMGYLPDIPAFIRLDCLDSLETASALKLLEKHYAVNEMTEEYPQELFEFFPEVEILKHTSKFLVAGTVPDRCCKVVCRSAFFGSSEFDFSNIPDSAKIAVLRITGIKRTISCKGLWEKLAHRLITFRDLKMVIIDAPQRHLDLIKLNGGRTVQDCEELIKEEKPSCVVETRYGIHANEDALLKLLEQVY